MTQITTVPLETADFLLGRLIATAKINDDLINKIKEYEERIERQRGYIAAQGEGMGELQKEIAKLKQLLARPRGRPKGSKSKAKVVSK